MTSAPRRAALVAAVLATLTVASCMTPAGDDDNYAHKAKQALKSALSETATAELLIKTSLRGRILDGYANQTMSQSEDALGSIGDSFGSVQPPDTGVSDQVQESTSTLLTAAADAVAAARIALRRHDRADMTSAEEDLRKLSAELRRAGDALP